MRLRYFCAAAEGCAEDELDADALGELELGVELAELESAALELATAEGAPVEDGPDEDPELLLHPATVSRTQAPMAAAGRT